MATDAKSRVRLRSLCLLALAITSIAAAWLGREFYISIWTPYRDEQPIIKKLESLGVRFSTEGAFGRVSDAFSPHSFIPEDCLDDLAKFKRLKRLELMGPKLSDAGTTRLSEMKQLVGVHMMFATDEQLRTLRASLPNCKIVCEVTIEPPSPNPAGKSESN